MLISVTKRNAQNLKSTKKENRALREDVNKLKREMRDLKKRMEVVEEYAVRYARQTRVYR